MKLTLTKLTCISGLAASLAVPLQAAEPTGLWEHSIGLGLTVTEGNSDTVTAYANWLSARKWEKNELRFGADGTYGETEGEKTAQSAHGFGQYNRLFGTEDRFYFYMRIDGYHDDIADIDYRVTISPGVGYYFIKNARTTLSGEVGPGYVFEKKGGETDDYATVRFAERFEHKFNDRVRLWQSLEFLPQIDDWENYVINAEIGVDTAMSKALSLRVFIQDTYTSQPADGREENDFKFVTALQYKFGS
jgi:putative salt-induced outer membrane protein